MGYECLRVIDLKIVAQCVLQSQPMKSNISLFLWLMALQRHYLFFFFFFKETDLSVTLVFSTIAGSPRSAV